jgi:hypothetical protein
MAQSYGYDSLVLRYSTFASPLHPVYGLRINRTRSLKGPLLLEDSVRT